MSSRILFVCLGNICRSPTAEGVFRHRARQAGFTDLQIDSAGTAGWHVGKAPDPRTVAAAQRRGYDLSALRARQVLVTDFDHFDFVLAMDRQNLAELKSMAPRGAKASWDCFWITPGRPHSQRCRIHTMAARPALSRCWILLSRPAMA